MFCKAWGERDWKIKCFLLVVLKNIFPVKKVVLTYFLLLLLLLLSPVLQSYSSFDRYHLYDDTVLHSNVQSLFPLEKSSRHNFGLVIKGELMSPPNFSKYFTPECGIWKHSHFPLLDSCSIARISTFQQIQKLVRMNIIYSRILIGYVWILCIILQKVRLCKVFRSQLKDYWTQEGE